MVQATDDHLITNRVLANAQVDINIAPSLKLTGSYGIDYSDGMRKTYIDRTLTIYGSPVPDGQADINQLESARTNSNAYLTWNRDFGKHNFNVVAGTELVTQTISTLSMSANNFPTDELKVNNIGAGLDQIRVGAGKNKWQTLGFFGRFNYNFNSKYYVSANFRRDGSSRFGASNKWAFFPSLALAWRPTEEAFLQTQDFVSDLKIRASIGQTGNGAIDPYSSIGLWSISTNVYSFDNQLVTGASLSRIANPDLRWETTTQYNIGFDARFLNGRLGLTFDYYLKNTDDLILDITIPKTSGFNTSRQNVGSLQNTGTELSVDYIVFDGNFHWDVNGNISFIQNKVTDLGDADYVEVASWPRRGGSRLYVGEPAGQIWGYIIEGVFDDQEQADNWPVDHGINNHKEGYLIYRDIDGDGVITLDDRTNLGTGTPTSVFGLTNRFRYQNFDLSVFFQGVTGADVVVFYQGDIDRYFRDTWTPENRDAEGPINTTGGNGNRGLTDNRQVHDASYIRLKNIRLGYTFPMEKVSFLGGINLYFNASNILTFTDYPGYNPDVSSGGTFAFGEGYDTGVYPLAKIYTVGLNVNF